MEKKLCRVLLIEDNPVDVRLIENYLACCEHARFELETAGELAQGLERLEQGGIDAVLLDLHLPDSRGLETFAAVRERAPQAPILVLTGLDDENLAERTVREGAQDYLIKGQVNAAQLARAIRYAVVRQEALAGPAGAKRGKTIAFMGAKGGAGTTTLALNVATALARQSLPVALVELHPGPGVLSTLLQVAPTGNLRHLLELELGCITTAELTSRMSKLSSGLRVLFGPQDVQEFGDIAPEYARTIVEELAREGSYVMLELPVGPSAANRAAVESCDYVVVALEPDPLSVRAAKATVRLLESWGLSRGLIGAVVVNRVLWTNPMSVREIRSDLECEVIGAIPPGGEAVQAAMQKGLPLILSRPESNTAAALNELASRLLRTPVSAGGL